jgi:hypothetical protein
MQMDAHTIATITQKQRNGTGRPLGNWNKKFDEIINPNHILYTILFLLFAQTELQPLRYVQSIVLQTN